MLQVKRVYGSLGIVEYRLGMVPNLEYGAELAPM